MTTAPHAQVMVVDFGSQYTHLIGRRLREWGHRSEVIPYQRFARHWSESKQQWRAVILSGGYHSVSLAANEDALAVVDTVMASRLPLLGVCFGWQAMTRSQTDDPSHSSVVRCHERGEYGRTRVRVVSPSRLLSRASERWHPDRWVDVWMSHADSVVRIPAGFRVVAVSGSTDNPTIALAEHESHPWFGVQFHPEVSHTTEGSVLLQTFIEDIAGCEANWRLADWLTPTIRDLSQRVGDDRVLCALSGGVDSLVTARLLFEAIGDRLTCVLVDTGLLRQNEAQQVVDVLHRDVGLSVRVEDAADRFFDALKGITDPEAKRKCIGRLFIRCFEDVRHQIGPVRYLAQGTLYPDVVESAAGNGAATVIKSHHNVGGLPANMKMALIEPLRDLYKDEVRQIGRLLGLPEALINRHPFPGPGLAVRILGDVTPQRVSVLQQVDAIYLDALHQRGLYSQIWQAFAVILGVRAVGVVGDRRQYGEVVALRAVTSVDGMTADAFPLDPALLTELASRIIAQVPQVGRVVYDVTSKPPGTIEWE